MSKEFVPYEEALAMKGLGFKEDCLGFWSKVHGLYITKTTGESKLFEGAGECKSPLYQQAFRWFREEHDLHIGICHQVNGKFDCWTNKGNLLENGKYCDIDSYEEAELACLRKLIETVNQNEDELD